jgi:hypothetical protein
MDAHSQQHSNHLGVWGGKLARHGIGQTKERFLDHQKSMHAYNLADANRSKLSKQKNKLLLRSLAYRATVGPRKETACMCTFSFDASLLYCM